jgi:hypothetical protein
MRFFNTAGPVNCQDHYCLPPLERIDLAEVMTLIAQKKYFVLHAPRQTGKTSTLLALMAHLNAAGKHRCLYVNFEVAQGYRERVNEGLTALLQEISRQARQTLHDTTADAIARDLIALGAPSLSDFLGRWCSAADRPTVLLIDEIDALVGDVLITVLRQLRAGYPDRPAAFPQSVVLCGVRDVRDYRIHSDQQKTIITGGSAFNIKAESLRLGDFSRAEVAMLYAQHSAETHQPFEPAAIEAVWALTKGQPWLVNALGYEVCFRMKASREWTRPITAAMIEEAKENLILRRETHLDQLADKLREDRVRRIIEPMLAGTTFGAVPPDDIQYVRDLGLCRMDPAGGLVIANPIYREVLPRVLASVTEASLPRIAATWLTPDGHLDLPRLLQAFLAFWRQHGQPLLGSAPYHEIAPHLVLMAFLHRVVNADGALEREYAIGSGRMDLCLRYRDVTLGIEIKVWRDGESDPLAEGLVQLDRYLDGLGRPTGWPPEGHEGWLVIFDRRSGQPPISQRTRTELANTPAGRTVTVIRG